MKNLVSDMFLDLKSFVNLKIVINSVKERYIIILCQNFVKIKLMEQYNIVDKAAALALVQENKREIQNRFVQKQQIVNSNVMGLSSTV